MFKDERIFVTGHMGMVGSRLLLALKKEGYGSIITATREELDLTEASAVDNFFSREKPDYVFLMAAKVGGIQANIRYPVEFLRDNLMIQNNIMHQCYQQKVKKLVFLGSSCMYPRDCPQPMKEDYLLSGPLEPTNEGYALAKIAGLKLLQYYEREYGLQGICPVPCNLYGPGDSFDLDKSHVLSALVKRFVDAQDDKKPKVMLWGTGIAKREFLHVDDLTRAIIFLMDKMNSSEPINVGSGHEISIKDLAVIIARKTNYQGKITWDTSKPDGMLRKTLDISKINALGFSPLIPLEQGIEGVIADYRVFKQKGKVT